MTRDLVVVGAGPAGVSAALWARALDLSVCVLESAPEPGGQLHHVHFHPHALAGVPEGDGPAIAAAYARQLAEVGVVTRYDVAAVTLEAPAGERAQPAVRLSTGERLEAGALLVATGVRRRRLDVPGERELEGRGVSTSATLDRVRFAGRPVAVVGGGDAAYENALLLAAVGSPVSLLVRETSRARPEFRARVVAEPRIRVIEGARVESIVGGDRVRAVRIVDGAGSRDLPVDGVVVKIGVLPNTEWCLDQLDHDESGFLRVDERFATSAPGVWAAGDVVRPALAGIAVSLGHGALAAAAIRTALREQ